MDEPGLLADVVGVGERRSQFNAQPLHFLGELRNVGRFNAFGHNQDRILAKQQIVYNPTIERDSKVKLSLLREKAF